jgi:hypothetical protein
MDMGQALLIVLSFPALAILLAAVTLIEEWVLGGPAASSPGNQPENGDMQISPSPYDPTRPIPSAHLPQHDHVLPAVTHDAGTETAGVSGHSPCGSGQVAASRPARRRSRSARLTRPAAGR